MDLGLFQRQVAVRIGVSEATVYGWERGTEPELVHIPKIIEFPWYVPFECPNDLLGQLCYFKLVNGMPFERLGSAMGRDPEQLKDWLSHGVDPCKRNLAKIANFLTGRVQIIKYTC